MYNASTPFEQIKKQIELDYINNYENKIKKVFNVSKICLSNKVLTKLIMHMQKNCF